MEIIAQFCLSNDLDEIFFTEITFSAHSEQQTDSNNFSVYIFKFLKSI